jgi:hypothetical protein
VLVASGGCSWSSDGGSRRWAAEGLLHPPSIKNFCCSQDLGGTALNFPLSSHCAGGEEEGIRGSVVLGGSAERDSRADGFPRAQHMRPLFSP